MKFLRHPNGDNDGVPLQLASISYPSVTLIKMATKFEVSPNSSTSSLRTHISTLNTSIKCVLVNIWVVEAASWLFVCVWFHASVFLILTSLVLYRQKYRGRGGCRYWLLQYGRVWSFWWVVCSFVSGTFIDQIGSSSKAQCQPLSSLQSEFALFFIMSLLPQVLLLIVVTVHFHNYGRSFWCTGSG